tara:strand:+ start:945 stop:2309 length:1365 start_codon:yes stop_codon:yes gene_type:complete
MQHKILLLDELGERWGESHTFYDLRTPADAIRLMCINYPDFGKYLATSHEQGIGYQVTQVGEELEASELLLPLGKHDLVITPVIVGSKGAGKIIVGALLIGAAIISSGAGFGAGGGFGFGSTTAKFSLAAAGGNIGIALVLSGVGDMLAPQIPTFDTSFDVGRGGYLGGPTSLEKGADGQQSYAYRGASNTVGIGKTIPLVYGKALVGSHLISTDIDVVNESDPLMTSFEKPSNATMRVNGEKIKFTGIKGKITDYDGFSAARVKTTFSIKRFGGPNANRELAGDGFQFVLNKQDDLGNLTPEKIGFVNLLGRGEQKILDNLSIDSDNTNNRLNTDFNIMITFSGLQDRIGNSQSTIIPAFITFAIIIKHTSSNSTVLNQQLTVQGTQSFTQSIRYIFNFEPVVVTTGNNSYKVFVKVIDTALFKTGVSTTEKDSSKMRIDIVGYDLLRETKNN